MAVLRDGTFDFVIGSDDLARGLRPTKRNPRNNKYLIECIGAVGLDRVLQVIDDLENDRIEWFPDLMSEFPWPQIFVFVDRVILCDEGSIHEWDGTSLTKKAPTGIFSYFASGELWSAVDFHSFVYMSNGLYAVIINTSTGEYEITVEQPSCKSMCNFNGQVIIGSPDLAFTTLPPAED